MRAKGSLRRSRSELFWYFRISRSATVPGRYLRFFAGGSRSAAEFRPAWRRGEGSNPCPDKRVNTPRMSHLEERATTYAASMALHEAHHYHRRRHRHYHPRRRRHHRHHHRHRAVAAGALVRPWTYAPSAFARPWRALARVASSLADARWQRPVFVSVFSGLSAPYENGL